MKWVKLKCDECGGPSQAKYNPDLVSRGQIIQVICDKCWGGKVMGAWEDLQRAVRCRAARKREDEPKKHVKISKALGGCARDGSILPLKSMKKEKS